MNRTALHLAALTGNADIYRRLVELGFDSKSLDQKGKTAEHYLRNNPAISSGELQELLALTNPNGTNMSTGNHPVNGNTRLSKMAGNKTSNKEVIHNNIKDVSPGTLKISSKPVRLQPLQQQQQTKVGENIANLNTKAAASTKISITSPTKSKANGKSAQTLTPATSTYNNTVTSGNHNANQLVLTEPTA